MSIRILPPEVAAKIAAGEVVERPASVVKELLENALDAGATQVSVEARGGGVSLIRVIDNGSGIAAAELETAFQRYATSKIASAADLDAISSLGFRGEALPSIAAVAEVTMVSRRPDELAGGFLHIEHGNMIEKAKRGCPVGTSVTVHHLFRNVPARLKFLKSAATENSHISQVVSHYSLAYPQVRFLLMLDGQVALRTPGSGQLRDALVAVYGLETARAMLEVKGQAESSPQLQVSGLVSPPSLSRARRGSLSFFVNRRWVNSRLLARAVEEAYQGLLMVGRHPVAVINITLPPHEVDANVHPAKLEVRFRQEGTVFAAVQRAVRAALVAESPVASFQPPTVPTQAQPFRPQPVPSPQTALFQPDRQTPIPHTETPQERLPLLRVMGQMSATYIIAEGPDGLYLIDQHTAHERVLFERIREQRQQQAVEVQGLLEPLALELSAAEAELLKEQKETLSRYGFDVEPFGDRTYLVRAVPAILGDADAAAAIRELLSPAEGDVRLEWEERIARTLACHSAVRAGQTLQEAEMRQLLRQLEQTQLPHTCPHGRPTMIHLSAWQLERQFGRK
ncbi:MAG: DNA mismatch repair endonuclease MutL [Chloroflexi bacterium]|nr:DNA mismatch repair endonuclease MutL [Chloroflexota bacterium]